MEMTLVSLHISLWLRFVSVPMCATSKPARHQSSQLGTGMQRWPHVWMAAQPATLSPSLRGSSPPLPQASVSPAQDMQLVEGASRARMSSLTMLSLNYFPAAAVGSGVLVAVCGSLWWQCHQHMFLLWCWVRGQGWQAEELILSEVKLKFRTWIAVIYNTVAEL